MVELNLLNPAKNQIPFKINTFPDGEIMIELDGIDRKKEVDVILRITNANDLFILLQIGDILNRHGVRFRLHITYLMSMRMDRVIDFNKPYNLSIVSKLINYINPVSVEIVEPHSDKSLDLIDNSNCEDGIVWEVINKYPTNSVICFPDEGAGSRYNKFVLPHIKKIYCEKERDENGKLINFSFRFIGSEDNIKGKDIIIVDDLCDGGGTFIGIAELFKKYEPKSLILTVTHAIQFEGLQKVANVYDKVFISNSYVDWDRCAILPKNVVVIDIL